MSREVNWPPRIWFRTSSVGEVGVEPRRCPTWPTRTTAWAAPGRSSRRIRGCSPRRAAGSSGGSTAGPSSRRAARRAAAAIASGSTSPAHDPGGPARAVVSGGGTRRRSSRPRPRDGRLVAVDGQTVGMVRRRRAPRAGRGRRGPRRCRARPGGAASVWPWTRSHSASGNDGLRRTSTARSRLAVEVGRQALEADERPVPAAARREAGAHRLGGQGELERRSRVVVPSSIIDGGRAAPGPPRSGGLDARRRRRGRRVAATIGRSRRGNTQSGSPQLSVADLGQRGPERDGRRRSAGGDRAVERRRRRSPAFGPTTVKRDPGLPDEVPPRHVADRLGGDLLEPLEVGGDPRRVAADRCCRR